MYIERVPNRNSPPAVLLRESYRQDGKVKKRTLANLSKWPDQLVEGLRTLSGRSPQAAFDGAIRACAARRTSSTDGPRANGPARFTRRPGRRP